MLPVPPDQPHSRLSSAHWSVTSLMRQFFHEVRRCESLIEAENDHLRHQLSYVSDIAERHQFYHSDSNPSHALALIRAALASDEDTGRDLELFGQRYTTRSRLQRSLDIAVQAMKTDFAALMTDIETRAASQFQEIIDVSTAIECELEDSIAHLQRQLSSERAQRDTLKAEMQALKVSSEACQLIAQSEMERLEHLLQCEQTSKHDCDLDLDAFRLKYEAQQWAAYQGSAELGCVQAELLKARGNVVFLEIENDQLQQHIRALNATIEYLSSANQSKSLARIDFRHRDADQQTSEATSRAKILPASSFLACELNADDRPEFVVCVDDVGFAPICSYLDGEFPQELFVSTSPLTVSTDKVVAAESDDLEFEGSVGETIVLQLL